jgi:D-inositol-3-phosphate glycosyltransferase
MKVLMVDALVGNDYSLLLCNSLAKAGLDVSLVVTEDRKVGEDIQFKIKNWLPSKSKGKNKIVKTYLYFKYLLKLYSYIKKEADVVHFQFFRRRRVESVFFWLLRKSGINLVHTVHDVIPLDESKVDQIFNKIVYRSSKSLIVHSEPNLNTLASTKVSREKIYIVPHGNFDVFIKNGALQKDEARRNLNLQNEDDLLLFFGFIKKYKGLDLLLDAFESAYEKNKKLKLLIAGAVDSNELLNHYNEKINLMNSKKNVIFHSDFIPQEKVAEYFTASDLVVLPYKQISHSGVMHLAYSFGRPLIVTDTGDFAYTVRTDNSGFVVGNYSSDNLAEIILNAFSDKERLEEMGKNILQLNSSKYSWLNVAEETKNVYLNTLKN